MLLKQQIVHDYDKEGTVHLYNTFDTGMAAELARDATNDGTATMKGGHVRLMGYIPPELFKCDPDLIMARMAEDAGEPKEVAKYMTQFFLKHKEYKVTAPKKYY